MALIVIAATALPCFSTVLSETSVKGWPGKKLNIVAGENGSVHIILLIELVKRDSSIPASIMASLFEVSIPIFFTGIESPKYCKASIPFIGSAIGVLSEIATTLIRSPLPPGPGLGGGGVEAEPPDPPIGVKPRLNNV